MDTASFKPSLRLWVYHPDHDGVFGDGKVRLLQAIAVGGSLRVAAAQLGMSYRKAWGDLKKAESCLGFALIEKTRGGIGGGQTILTERGHQLVEAFIAFRRTVDTHVDHGFRAFLSKISE